MMPESPARPPGIASIVRTAQGGRDRPPPGRGRVRRGNRGTRVHRRGGDQHPLPRGLPRRASASWSSRSPRTPPSRGCSPVTPCPSAMSAAPICRPCPTRSVSSPPTAPAPPAATSRTTPTSTAATGSCSGPWRARTRRTRPASRVCAAPVRWCSTRATPPPGTTSFSSPPRAGPRRPSPGSPASASTGSGATRPTVETLRAELASARPPLVLDMRNCGEREVYDLFGGYAAWESAA